MSHSTLSSELVICRIGPEGATFIAEVDRECSSPAWALSVIQGELSNNNCWCFVARHSAQILGFIMAHIVAGESHILNLGVLNSHRRFGIGRSLLDRFIATCREQGVRHILLEVRKSNLPAIRLYDEFGFHQVGVRRGYYADTGEDGIVLRRDL